MGGNDVNHPFRDPFRDLDRLASQLVSGTRTPAPMPMDAWRSADGFHVALDLPGVDPATTELTVERNSLTVQATRQAVFGDDDQVLTAERPQGSFTRQLILGDDVDAENVRADYTNGVLNLTIPVKQSAQPRRIEIGHDVHGGQQRPQVIDVTDEAPKDTAQTTPQPETVSAN